MHLTIEESSIAAKFYSLFANLAGLINHVCIYISPEGLYMQGMDPSQICLFDVNITSQWFTTYSSDKEKTSICVSTRFLEKILSTYKSDQIMDLNINYDTDTLNISFINGTTTCDKFFELPMIDVNNEIIKLSDTESHVELCMTSKKLTELVSQIEIFDKIVTFELSEKKVLMKASGDKGSMMAKLSLEDSQLLDYAVMEGLELSQSFSLKHIKLMIAFNKIAKEVKLELTKDRPLIMTYDLEKESTLKLVLAPNIED